MCKLSGEAISDILAHGRLYEVGGAVRDRYLKPNQAFGDHDYLVTGIPYRDLAGILKHHGRVDLVGRSFGVIKFTQFRAERSFTFDISLPRKEYSIGVGHKDFDVSFDPDLSVEEDLQRRDFTINAMALALTESHDIGELIDPLGGMVDLTKRQLRMTSPASFNEDPLRMLRAVQFAARFEFMIEPETFRAMRKHAEAIKTVSAERIADELTKLLTRAERPSEGLRIMQSSGLLTHVLPELEECVGVDQPGGYHKFDVFEHTLHVVDATPPRLRIRLAALFHDITKPRARRLTETGATFYGHEVTGSRVAERALNRLRFPKELAQQVSKLVERHMFTTDVTDKGLRRLVRKVGQDLIFDLLDLRRADVEGQGMGGTTEDVDEFEANVRAELEKKPPFGLSDLALDGKDVMRMFELAPSKAVGRILDHLMEAVLDNPELNAPEALASLAREYYQEHILDSDTEK
ncbi:HD domain-containing protein [candidate division GN15 bacterium]|nr:HD domain-containing protein [candidate division GN15 bacterium]